MPVSCTFVRVIEVRQKTLDRVRERYRVSVEHDDVFGPGVGDLQRLTECTALVALAAVAMEDLELWPVDPSLQDLHRLVGGVIDHDDLVPVSYTHLTLPT